MPIKLTTTTGQGGGGREKKSKRIDRTSQNMSFSWVPAVRVLSRTGSHSPPHLPRMPSNIVPISGPAVRAAQILIWFFSYVFLPPVSTAVRTSAFSFVGALNNLLYITQTQSLPSWSCGSNLHGGFNLQLVERFYVFFLSQTVPGYQLWLYFHLCMWVVHWGLLLRLPWRTWVFSCEGPVLAVVKLLGLRGFWQHQVLKGIGG